MMGQDYYAQPFDLAPTTPTMTVAQLAERLASLPQDLPVVFETPTYGAFGSNHTYAIDGAEIVTIDAWERDYPASTYIDDETGKAVDVEAWTDRRNGWTGVVIK